jgi:hypothetical protein
MNADEVERVACGVASKQKNTV